MNFNEAIELKKKNEHLIGQKYRGGTIEELIVRPILSEEFDAFAKSYIRTMDADLALQPIVESRLTVDAICDRAKIKTSNIFFRTKLENLADENLEVNF